MFKRKNKENKEKDFTWEDFKTNKALIKQVVESCLADENLTCEMITLDGTRLIFRYNENRNNNRRPIFSGDE